MAIHVRVVTKSGTNLGFNDRHGTQEEWLEKLQEMLKKKFVVFDDFIIASESIETVRVFDDKRK